MSGGLVAVVVGLLLVLVGLQLGVARVGAVRRCGLCEAEHTRHDRRRPWLAAAALGLTVIAMNRVAEAVPARLPEPTPVRGTAVRVDAERGVFRFARGGFATSAEYPLDNPMWVDRDGVTRGGRPECLVARTAPQQVELALLDVRGVPEAGVDNLRLLVSVRCLD
ncbi:hypothetical protein V5P93_000256 [Actinokineospora auranticolor]|uniref:hypothetical protein n=1 Tax=Actinokineospora auranticolor TaxID=155976 RepID=UPI0035A8F97C